MSFYVFLFILTAFLNSLVQILLKKGAPYALGQFASNENLAIKLFKIITNPNIFSAAVILFGGMYFWFKILSHFDLSIAYPINISLTIILTFLAAIIFFGETFSLVRLGGIVLIVAGIFILFIKSTA